MTINIQNLTYEKLAKTLDHALLKPEMTEADVIAGCSMAKKYKLAAVSVKPCYLPLVVRELKGSGVAAGTVVSFPHGHSSMAVKVYEALNGVENGAVELDIVMNIGALRSGAHDYVRDEIGAIADAVGGRALVKVILETHYLTDPEKIVACQLLEEAGVDFVKTSTGYADRGASVEDIRLMRKTVGPKIQVKAAGGMRTLTDVLSAIQAGATRVGTSATETILEEFLAQR
jgi:deoxyribose-phosphate aldolase